MRVGVCLYACGIFGWELSDAMYGEWSSERKRHGGVCEDARKGCKQGTNER